MFEAVLTKIFGSKNEREVKKLLPKVDEINALEPSIKALSDEQLKGKTAEFKERLAKGSPVQVEGRLKAREYEDKAGQTRKVLEVEARRVQFLASTSAAKKEEPAAAGEEHEEAPF